jgi:hypothetical protein
MALGLKSGVYVIWKRTIEPPLKFHTSTSLSWLSCLTWQIYECLGMMNSTESAKICSSINYQCLRYKIRAFNILGSSHGTSPSWKEMHNLCSHQLALVGILWCSSEFLDFVFRCSLCFACPITVCGRDEASKKLKIFRNNAFDRRSKGFVDPCCAEKKDTPVCLSLLQKEKALYHYRRSHFGIPCWSHCLKTQHYCLTNSIYHTLQ